MMEPGYGDELQAEEARLIGREVVEGARTQPDAAGAASAASDQRLKSVQRHLDRPRFGGVLLTLLLDAGSITALVQNVRCAPGTVVACGPKCPTTRFGGTLTRTRRGIACCQVENCARDHVRG